MALKYFGHWTVHVSNPDAFDSTHISYECCLFFLQGYVQNELD